MPSAQARRPAYAPEDRAADETAAQAAIAAAGMHTFSVDYATGMVRMSAGAFALHGLAPTADGRIALEAVRARAHPEDRDTIGRRIARLQRDGGTDVVAYRILRADTGETRWVERYGAQVATAGGAMRMTGLLRDVTAERAAAQVAERAEQRRRLSMELTGTFSAELDVAAQEVVGSATMFATYGLAVPPDGRTTAAAIRAQCHPDDRARVRAETLQMLREGGQQISVFRILRADDGAVRWIERRSTAWTDGDGKQWALSVGHDITAQRLDEVMRRESETRLRLALDAAQLFMADVDMETGIALATPALFRTFGLPVAADGRFTLQEIRDPLHPGDRDRIIAATERLLRTGGTDSTMARIIRVDDGAERWLERHLTVVDGADGQRHIVFIGRDITEQRNAELALALSEVRRRLAVESAGMCTVEIDPQSGRVEMSENAFRVHGLAAPADGVITLGALRAHVHPDDRAAVAANTDRLAREGGRSVDSFRITAADSGEIRWLERHATVVEVGAGTTHVISLLRDITERRRTELALAESETRLRLAIAAAEMFTMEVDVETGQTVASDRAFAAHGLPLPADGDVHIDYFRDHIHPDDLPAALITHAELESGGTATRVFRLVRADSGEIRWLERHVTLRVGSDGRMRRLAIFRDVTAQHRDRIAMVESEARLRLAMEVKGFAAWDQDPDTGEAIWSESHFTLLGYPPDPAGMARPDMFRSRVHPDDLGGYLAARAHAIADGSDFDHIVRARRLDGTLLWLETHGRLFSDHGGRHRFIGIIRDITAARAAEAAREAAQERLRLALEATEEGVWDWDVRADALWMSERCQTMRGLAPDSRDPDADSWARDLHPEDLCAFQAGLRAHLRGETPGFAAEYRVRHQDGHWVWILDRGKVVRRDADGRPLRVVGTHQDISRQKAMAEALAAGEARLRALLAVVPESVMVLQRDGMVSDINEAGRKLLQAPAIMGLAEIAAREFVAPSDHDGWVLNHARVCAGRGVRWEYDIVGYRGRRLRVEAQGVPLPMPDGTVAHLAVMRDVTAPRAAETRLRKLQAEAIRASRVSAMGAMAAGLAHELNQPLSAAVNYASAAALLLAAATPETIDAHTLAWVRETIDRTVTQAMRSGDIVRRLRDFIGRGGNDPCSLSPATLIEEASDTVRPYAVDRPGGETAIVICADIAPDAGAVFGDRVQLVQVLTNLIRNAVDATLRQPRSEIVVAASRAAARNGMEFAVSDNGPGLSAGMTKQLFEPFTSGKPGGMGIGLVICRTIVESHGGRIWAERRRAGHGACFRFFIPDAETGG